MRLQGTNVAWFSWSMLPLQGLEPPPTLTPLEVELKTLDMWTCALPLTYAPSPGNVYLVTTLLASTIEINLLQSPEHFQAI